jgi:hypothetical protein
LARLWRHFSFRWNTFGGKRRRTPKASRFHVIYAVIRGIHGYQIFFPRAGRIGCRCICAVRAAPIARHATDPLPDTGKSESARRTQSDTGSGQSKACATAFAMPMRPIDFRREIAETATDTADIHVQDADAGIRALRISFCRWWHDYRNDKTKCYQ